MTHDEFTERYQLLKGVTLGQVRTFHAQAGAGAVVMAHLIDPAAPALRDEIVGAIERLNPQDRRKVLGIHEVDGVTTVVTRFILDFESLQAWLDSCQKTAPEGGAADLQDVAGFGTPLGSVATPDDGFGVDAASAPDPVGSPAEPTGQVERPMPDAPASGGLEGSSGPEPSPRTDPLDVQPAPPVPDAAAPAPAPESANPRPEPDLPDEPGEFTRLFAAASPPPDPPSSTPEASARPSVNEADVPQAPVPPATPPVPPATPPVASAPPVPPSAPPVQQPPPATPPIQSDPPVTPPAPELSAESEPESEPGEFTRMFAAHAPPPEPGAPPSAPAEPTSTEPAAATEPPSGEPAAESTPEPPTAPGDFTRLFAPQLGGAGPPSPLAEGPAPPDGSIHAAAPPSPPAPGEAPAPTEPPPSSSGDPTQAGSSDEPAFQLREPAAEPTVDPSEAPGDFTLLFAQPAVPEERDQPTPAAPSSSPPSPAAEPEPATAEDEPGEFTRLFEAHAPTPAEPPAPEPEPTMPPVPPPAPPAAPAAEAQSAPEGPGEFTRMFQSPVPPPTPGPGSGVGTPPSPPSGPSPPAAPTPGMGEYTRLFSTPGQIDPRRAATPPQVPTPGGVTPPAAPRPDVGGGDLLDRLRPAAPPATPAPPRMPAPPAAPAGPGEYTRLLSAQPPPPPAAPTAPTYGAAPPGAPAQPDAGQPQAAKKANRLPLIIGLIVVVVLTVGLLVTALVMSMPRGESGEDAPTEEQVVPDAESAPDGNAGSGNAGAALE